MARALAVYLGRNAARRIEQDGWSPELFSLLLDLPNLSLENLLSLLLDCSNLLFHIFLSVLLHGANCLVTLLDSCIDSLGRTLINNALLNYLKFLSKIAINLFAMGIQFSLSAKQLSEAICAYFCS